MLNNNCYSLASDCTTSVNKVRSCESVNEDTTCSSYTAADQAVGNVFVINKTLTAKNGCEFTFSSNGTLSTQSYLNLSSTSTNLKFQYNVTNYGMKNYYGENIVINAN